jgi:hypothetical protein
VGDHLDAVAGLEFDDDKIVTSGFDGTVRVSRWVSACFCPRRKRKRARVSPLSLKSARSSYSHDNCREGDY